MTVELTACTYAYGRRKAPVLEDFNYQLPEGLTILLGPNGAGKSTLLKLAAAVVQPRSGDITFGRLSSRSKAYRTTVAWMPQNISAMPSLTVREYVAYVGWLKGMSRSDAWDRSAEAVASVELTDKSDAKTDQLSGGQLRRVGVASALVHDARVLLLDEPTAGMDPHQRRVFHNLLNGLTDRVQVLLSTHDVTDLAEEADHVAVLHGGSLLHSGTTPSFLAHAPQGSAPARLAEEAYTSLLGSRASI
ncbi:ATP-binding cassette domain-containing protein [Streptomyces piniterrae]|uniref:ATP-binding cassette domain-containing protein n=1 Tax=Streptomyces piniterrae TaxID=2571125 RepID=A0A4U0N7E7_9ACTN|nr:ATP-binding cassette domain-containing protein [Streptomyces piniterrae]TJZ49473.1 ATP-binding cassette domain-containing protein [Streptomyces piniterrae]